MDNNVYQNQSNGRRVDIPQELLTQENIAVCVILSIVTCGIYNFFWYYKLCRKAMLATGEEKDIIAEYLLLILVPYYYLYWLYTRSQRISQGAFNNYGVNINDDSVICIILALVGFPIVSYVIMQNNLNKLALELQKL